MSSETKKAPTDVEALAAYPTHQAGQEHTGEYTPVGIEAPSEFTWDPVPCDRHADVGGVCTQCNPAVIIYRQFEANRLADIEDRKQQRSRDIEEYLANRRALWFPSEAVLDDYRRVLDTPDLDEPVPGGEHGEVETFSDRLINHAHAEGLLYANDADDGPVVLFVALDERTAALFTPQQRAECPDVRVFPACPGLSHLDLSRRFDAAGLNLDDYAPTTSPSFRLTAETFEALTDGDLDDEEDDLPDDTEDDDVTEPAADARNAPLDLRRLRSEPRPPTVYREPGIIPVGRYVGLSGEAGAGKSVLVRDMCVRWSLGRSALDPAHSFDPANVVYLDAENGPEWWAAGLDKMDAPLDLPNLRVICYPELDGGLDTERGARSFLRFVESLGEVDVLVLDTVSRFVEGGENDSDTWHSVYRLAILPLRRVGIDVLRLDHTGKDAALGARGSSAKMSDLDAHYVLTATAKGSNDLTLKLDKRRQADYDESVRIRRQDGPLGHVRVQEGKLSLRTVNGREVPENERVAALVADLDRLHITYGYGRVRAQEEYTTKGGEIKAGNSVWVDAIKFRSERADREAEQ